MGPSSPPSASPFPPSPASPPPPPPVSPLHVRCGCDILRNSVTFSRDVLCVKVEASRRVCTPARDGWCSDGRACRASSRAPTCEDKKATRKCIKKRRKGRCHKKKFRETKCPKTCEECFV